MVECKVSGQPAAHFIRATSRKLLAFTFVPAYYAGLPALMRARLPGSCATGHAACSRLRPFPFTTSTPIIAASQPGETGMSAPDIVARIRRLEQLNLGIVSELQRVEKIKIFMYRERRDYFDALRRVWVGLENARIALAKALRRIEGGAR
jgi:hypothetical protein